MKKKVSNFLLNKKWLRVFYAITFGAVFPIIIFFIVKDPVDILSVAAVLIPIVVFLTLHLNPTRLPEPVRPGKLITIAMWLSDLAYAAFAVFISPIYNWLKGSTMYSRHVMLC